MKKNVTKKINHDNKGNIFVSKLDYNKLDDPFMRERIHRTDKQILQEIPLLLKWAYYEPNAYSMDQYYAFRGIYQRTFQKWCARCPELEDAKQQAKRLLGIKREHGAMNRELDKDVALRTLHLFLDEYKDVDKYHADLKKTADAAQAEGFMEGVRRYVAAQEVILQPLPESDMVPRKPTPEEVAGKINRITGYPVGKSHKREE